jgi:cytoskeletal protein CcmA (bactofilin family)
MFGKGSETAGGDKHGHSILQEGMQIVGSLEAKGDVRLDGKLDGKIRVSDRLTVGTSGEVHADIDAGEAIIMGAVEGTIRAHRRLELRKGARVVGDIASPILIIEEGVHFHGNCNMRPAESIPTVIGFEALPAKAGDTSADESRYENTYQ